jgi:DNA-binding PadR family transcriptional regulator
VDYRAAMTTDDRDEPDEVGALLPLQHAEFHILLALSGGDCHGYGIIQDVEARTNGALRLSPGTLYRTIQRLLEQGLIEEPRTLARRVGKSDPRRRYYRITPLGTAVARAETHRLTELVRLAKYVWRVAESS